MEVAILIIVSLNLVVSFLLMNKLSEFPTLVEVQYPDPLILAATLEETELIVEPEAEPEPEPVKEPTRNESRQAWTNRTGLAESPKRPEPPAVPPPPKPAPLERPAGFYR